MIRKLMFVVFGAAMLLVGTASGASADDHPSAGSELDGWNMTGELFIEGGAGDAAIANFIPCWDVHEAITEWNIATGFSYNSYTYRHYALHELPSLFAWLSSESATVGATFTLEEAEFCNKNNYDGWMVATDEVVSTVEADDHFLVTITGEVVECNFGEVLMSNATYYYWYTANEYRYGFGTWSGGPGPGAAGHYEFMCLPIFDGATGVAEVIDAVPSTQVNTNPDVRGLTGLDMWLWYEFNAQETYELGPLQASTIDSRGEVWGINVHAWVDMVMWDVDCETDCDYRGMKAAWGNAGVDYDIDLADTSAHPAATYDGGEESQDGSAHQHLYELRGDYAISTAAQWRGLWWVTTNGGAVVGAPSIHDPIIVAESLDLPVISVRTELRKQP